MKEIGGGTIFHGGLDIHSTSNKEGRVQIVAEEREVLTMEHILWSWLIYNLQDLAMKKHSFYFFECSPDTADLYITRALLKNMRGIDVGGTLDYLREKGWYCDCELLRGQGIGPYGRFTDLIDRGNIRK
ncbi:hypothetical protein [Desulfonatronum parangueonense]